MLQDVGADRWAAGERDLGRPRVPHERLTGDRAVAVHQFEHAVGQARLAQAVGHQHGCERGLLRRLEHDGVAGGQRRRHLVRHQVEGKLNGVIAETTPSGARR